MQAYDPERRQLVANAQMHMARVAASILGESPPMTNLSFDSLWVSSIVLSVLDELENGEE